MVMMVVVMMTTVVKMVVVVVTMLLAVVEIVLVSERCYNNVPQVGWLKQQKCIVSQFVLLSHSTCKYGFLLRSTKESLLHVSFLTSCGLLVIVSLVTRHPNVYVAFSLCACLSLCPNFHFL